MSTLEFANIASNFGMCTTELWKYIECGCEYTRSVDCTIPNTATASRDARGSVINTSNLGRHFCASRELRGPTLLQTVLESPRKHSLSTSCSMSSIKSSTSIDSAPLSSHVDDICHSTTVNKHFKEPACDICVSREQRNAIIMCNDTDRKSGSDQLVWGSEIEIKLDFSSHVVEAELEIQSCFSSNYGFMPETPALSAAPLRIKQLGRRGMDLSRTGLRISSTWSVDERKGLESFRDASETKLKQSIKWPQNRVVSEPVSDRTPGNTFAKKALELKEWIGKMLKVDHIRRSNSVKHIADHHDDGDGDDELSDVSSPQEVRQEDLSWNEHLQHDLSLQLGLLNQSTHPRMKSPRKREYLPQGDACLSTLVRRLPSDFFLAQNRLSSTVSSCSSAPNQDLATYHRLPSTVLETDKQSSSLLAHGLDDDTIGHVATAIDRSASTVPGFSKPSVSTTAGNSFFVNRLNSSCSVPEIIKRPRPSRLTNPNSNAQPREMPQCLDGNEFTDMTKEVYINRPKYFDAFIPKSRSPGQIQKHR